ncbi:MAG TPA: hypothetical protein VFS13_10970 [Steroidobacteraceae bacterium]|nr:hypothetical protein [Steroidobacteraceae bacterium]
MTSDVRNDFHPRQRAKEAARRALDDECDLLLACRELSQLKSHLGDVPGDVVDIFVGVASEIDDLPIGTERMRWSLDALATNDVKARKYRDEVRDIVVNALKRLLVLLKDADS